MRADINEKYIILENNEVTEFLKLLDFNINYLRAAIDHGINPQTFLEEYKRQLKRSEKLYNDLMANLGKEWREKIKT